MRKHWDTGNILIMGGLYAWCRYAGTLDLDSLKPFKDKFKVLFDGDDNRGDCAFSRCARATVASDYWSPVRSPVGPHSRNIG